MFENPPSWTQPLANLSGWFVWPAISAFLSFIALMATIKLADRSRREARRKEQASLLGVASALETVLGVHEGMLGRLTNANYRVELAAASEVAMASHFSEVLDQLKLTDIPTPAAAEAFVSVRAWMRRMPTWLKDWEQEEFDTVRRDLASQLKYLRSFQRIFVDDAQLVMTEFSWWHRAAKTLKAVSARLRSKKAV